MWIIRSALAIAVSATLLTATAAVQAQGPASTAGAPAASTEISVETFREQLGRYGTWTETGAYGLAWAPSGISGDWKPYRDGRWLYADGLGWYWRSSEAWGWATYHYGRWVLDAESGWLWLPGLDWAPAWVSWAVGDEAIGWAPLQPIELENDADEEAWTFVTEADFLAEDIGEVALDGVEYSRWLEAATEFGETTFENGVAKNTLIDPARFSADDATATASTRAEPETSGRTVAEPAKPAGAEDETATGGVVAYAEPPGTEGLYGGGDDYPLPGSQEAEAGGEAASAEAEAAPDPGPAEESTAALSTPEAIGDGFVAAPEGDATERQVRHEDVVRALRPHLPEIAAVRAEATERQAAQRQQEAAAERRARARAEARREAREARRDRRDDYRRRLARERRYYEDPRYERGPPRMVRRYYVRPDGLLVPEYGYVERW